MTTVLVAVAGRHGATASIAEEIASVLRRELPEAQVEVRDAADPGDLTRFDAVLVGSAIYMGRWLPAARHLVESHRAQLAAVPLWMFSSGPLGDPPRPSRSARWSPNAPAATNARHSLRPTNPDEPATRSFTAGIPSVKCRGPRLIDARWGWWVLSCRSQCVSVAVRHFSTRSSARRISWAAARPVTCAGELL